MSQPQKSYKNLDFLNSTAARPIRILCEYEEPRSRFRAMNVHDTIVFFGSARALPATEAGSLVHHAERELHHATSDEERRRLEHQLKVANRKAKLARYYEDARELARRLTEWSMARPTERRYYVCSGGGPGIMEAANRGASEVPGGKSVGLAISLPFEEKINPFCTPELSFEFHYFFMRKYWFVYLAKATVMFPGGFGTLDELFETFTLRQTRKVKKRVPTVLFGHEYWDSIADFQSMVDWGTISENDLLLFHRSDSVDDAFDYLVDAIEESERQEASRAAENGGVAETPLTLRELVSEIEGPTSRAK